MGPSWILLEMITDVFYNILHMARFSRYSSQLQLVLAAARVSPSSFQLQLESNAAPFSRVSEINILVAISDFDKNNCIFEIDLNLPIYQK